MQAPAELNAADVNELATSWINAQSVGASNGETVMELQQALSSPPTISVQTPPAVAPPGATGLLEGTQTSDINVPLESEDSGAPGASGEVPEQAVAQPGVDQLNSTASRELEPAPAAKRANNNAQSTAEPPSRAVEVNRRAQKRFRLKQKERFQEIQARLEKTTSELLKREQMIADLRQSQQQLHRRNIILESMQQTSGRSALPAGLSNDAIPASLGMLNRQYVAQEIGESGILVLSLLGGTAQVTISELSTMHIADFSKIYTLYIRTLGGMFAAQRKDMQARMFTKQLAKELGHLIECVKLVNVDCFKAMIEGAVDPTLAASVKMDQPFYENLTNLLGLSPEQHEDMTYLRRLYFTRRAVLAQERRKLEQQLASASHSQLNIPLPTDRLTEMSTITAQLQHVAEEDCRVYFRSMTAMRRKVATAEQVATACVHTFPYMVTGEQWFGAYKSPTSQETREEIAAAASSNDMRTEWEDLEACLAEPTWEGQPGTRLSQRVASRKASPQQSYGSVGSRVHSLYSHSQHSIPTYPSAQLSSRPSGGSHAMISQPPNPYTHLSNQPSRSPHGMISQQPSRTGRSLLMSLDEPSSMSHVMYKPSPGSGHFGGADPAPSSNPDDMYGSMLGHEPMGASLSSRPRDMFSDHSSRGARSHDIYSHDPVSIPGDQLSRGPNNRLRELFGRHLTNLSQSLQGAGPDSPALPTSTGHPQSAAQSSGAHDWYSPESSRRSSSAAIAGQSSVSPGLYTMHQRPLSIPPAVSAEQSNTALGLFGANQRSHFNSPLSAEQSSPLGLFSTQQTNQSPPEAQASLLGLFSTDRMSQLPRAVDADQRSQLDLYHTDQLMSSIPAPAAHSVGLSTAAQQPFGLDASSRLPSQC